MYGRVDVSTISLGATKWTFALPKSVCWKEVRATTPTITEPAGRCFVHCIQHWIVKRMCQGKSRFRKYSKEDLEQETLLIDNHGQQYSIHVTCGLMNDMGVKYFTIQPDPAYEPLTAAQIQAVKDVKPIYAKGEEGLPFLESQVASWKRAVSEAIASPSPVAVAAVAAVAAVTADVDMFPEIVGQRPMNPKIEEPEFPERFPLHPLVAWHLKQAYIHMYHSTIAEEKEEAKHLLSSYLKRILTSEAHHVRIDAMNRTQLARKLAKYYDIEFPAAAEKTLTPYKKPSILVHMDPIIHVQQRVFPLAPPLHD